MRAWKAAALLALAATGSVDTAAAQTAGTTMAMDCQQNKDDGRLLIANGNMLPENWGFKILRYRPTRTDAMGWTYGPCTIRLTKPLPVRH